jgi:hypothetical protein
VWGKGVWEEPVGYQPLKERNQEACQKDSRIRGTKECSREKIPGSGGRCGKKNKTKRMKQRKDFRIRQRCVKRMPGSGDQKNGREKRFQYQAVSAERRTLGSGGQKNGAEKRFQDQIVDAQKERNREKIPGSGGGASKGLKDQGDKRMEQRKDSRIKQLLRKERLQDQGDKRVEQRKDSRIRRSMWKKNKNKKKETEKRLPCGSLLGGVGVVLVQPLKGRCESVGVGCLGGTSRTPAP